jgi:hypothetical protein
MERVRSPIADTLQRRPSRRDDRDVLPDLPEGPESAESPRSERVAEREDRGWHSLNLGVRQPFTAKRANEHVQYAPRFASPPALADRDQHRPARKERVLVQQRRQGIGIAVREEMDRRLAAGDVPPCENLSSAP